MSIKQNLKVVHEAYLKMGWGHVLGLVGGRVGGDFYEICEHTAFEYFLSFYKEI